MASFKYMKTLNEILKRIPLLLKPLAKEAKKCKSLEDWVKSYNKNISNEKANLKKLILNDFIMTAERKKLNKNIFSTIKQ